MRELEERVLVDLEQLVARIGLQHVDQRLAGMAVGIEAGAREHGVDLAAQIRDGAGRARIGGRGEQADDAELADQPAVRVEALDADVVHVDAPVHARAHGRLGDDQQRRLLQERADLRRDHQRLVPALQHPHVAGAQDAEPGVEHRIERVLAGGEGVVAHAEEGEVVVGQPFAGTAIASAISSTGSGGGLVLELGDRPRRRGRSIARQSCTQTRTSASTASSAATSVGAPSPRRRCARDGCG